MRKFLLLLFTMLSLFLLMACSSTSKKIDSGNSNDNASNSSFSSNTSDQSAAYTLKTYSSTDEYGNAGAYTKINSQYNAGDAVELEATVNTGYNFEGWYIGDICVSKNLSYSFTMQEENIDLEARWSYYTVTVESHTNELGMAGTYSKKDNEKISVGETVTLTATVEKGYNFEGWYIDNICVGKDLIYQFVMDESNKTIRVEYSYYTFSSYGIVAKSGWLDSTPIENTIGTCTSYDCQKIASGDTVKLEATVCNGYTFEGWYLNNICISTDYEYTYTMTKENVSLVAKYTYYTLDVCAYDPATYLIYYTNDIGDVSFYNSAKVQVGETITLTAIGKNGYRFVGWTHGLGGITVSTDNTYTFVMEATDESYVAIFEKI